MLAQRLVNEMSSKDKLDEIADELYSLKEALGSLQKAIDEYESIDWPTGMQAPHHVEMEMSSGVRLKRTQQVTDR